MKVFVAGGELSYANFLEEVSFVDKIEEAEVVLFTGGADVTPYLYGCKQHHTTNCNPSRDLADKEIFNQIKENQVALGICRGSQFLCVMNGGLLIQNVTNHAIDGTHGITNGDVTYYIPSVHHQMQYPYNLSKDDYEVLFISKDRRSNCYEGDLINQNLVIKFGEPEIVLYHKSRLPKCLSVQGRPEMIPESPVSKMISKLVKKLVDKNK